MIARLGPAHPSLRLLLGVPAFYATLYVLLFSPILFGELLFPSDGQLAAFFSPVELWNPRPLAGMPGLAEPHLQQLYPVRWIFAALPATLGFNAFMIASYVMASSFAFGYAFAITNSKLAGAMGGLAFGMSGYMIAHLGHTGLVPAAAWLPLVMWSIEELRKRVSILWVLVAVASVAMVILAGHPQAFAYTIYLGFAYVFFLGRTSSLGWFRFVIAYLAIICAGTALAAPHLLPMLELADLSVRSELSFEAFKEYSLPILQLPMLLFPYLFGGAHLPGFPAYFGNWNLAEISGYVGFLTLMLAAVGGGFRWKEPLGAFWLGAAIVTFLLALGDATPLLRATFHLPAIGKLRAPARHLHEMTFALSVLCAMGVCSLQRVRDGQRVCRFVIAAWAVVMVATAGWIVVFWDDLRVLASARGIELSQRYVQYAVMVPMLLFVVSAIGLLVWLRDRVSRIRGAILLAILAIDLGTFAAVAEWRQGTPVAFLKLPEAELAAIAGLEDTHQRLMTMRGWDEPILPFSPMMSQLYGISSVGGYGPLLIQRYAEMSLVTNGGWINPSVLRHGDRTPDLLSAKYIVVPRPQSRHNPLETTRPWSATDLTMGLGTGCHTANPGSTRIELPASLLVDRIGLVSRMACATSLPQGIEVAKLTLVDLQGNPVVRWLRAGEDTAEWAIDCSDVAPTMKHQRPRVFDSWLTVRSGFPDCKGHRFVAFQAVEARRYKELSIDWLGTAPSVISISKVSLFDSRSNSVHAVSDLDFLFGDPDRFRRVRDFEHSVVFENLRALPRAWLVPSVVVAQDKEILATLRTSLLPDGSRFDPRQVALVERPLALHRERGPGQQLATIANLSAASVEVTTQADDASLLVLSDLFYPGWTATVDGRETEIFRTNYALRGVVVPPGRHTVIFRYEPASARMGWVILALGVLGLALTCAHLARVRSGQAAKGGRTASAR